MKYVPVIAMSAACFSASPASPSNALMLGQRTPAGACGDPNDCGFKRGAVTYISFEEMITRREVCSPAAQLFDVARKGDRLEVVRKRLQRAGRVYIKAEKRNGGWVLSAGSRTDEFMGITVTFDRRGQVRCVMEMLTSV